MGEEGYLEIDIKQMAKESMQKNDTIMRNIGQEKLDDVFGKIYIFNTQEEFMKKCGGYSSFSDGFNQKDYICISPEATPYTIIREVLQYVTSDFTQDGGRIKNGIAQNQDLGQYILNQGLLECLATKISGEAPRYQLNKKAIFSRLEPMIISYTRNEDILLETLLNNQSTVHDFVENFADKADANNILNSITDIEVEQLEKAFRKMEKRVNRHCLINKVKQRIRTFFNKTERNALPASKSIPNPITPREKFIENYTNSVGKKIIQPHAKENNRIEPIQTNFNREEEIK